MTNIIIIKILITVKLSQLQVPLCSISKSDEREKKNTELGYKVCLVRTGKMDVNFDSDTII